MKSLKHKVDEFLLKEIGIIPIISSYVIHTDYEAYCKKFQRDPKSESFFAVRGLVSHLRADSPSLAQNFLHEHYGHGLFCEYSKTGRRLWQYEQDLAGLEKQLLGVDKLPEDVVLNVSAHHPLIPDYLKLKKESERFFLENLDKYEGFAYWIEAWLGKKFNCGRGKFHN